MLYLFGYQYNMFKPNKKAQLLEWVDLWQLLYLKNLMVGDEGCSAGSYLAAPASPIPSHYAVITLFKGVSVHQLSWLAL